MSYNYSNNCRITNKVRTSSNYNRKFYCIRIVYTFGYHVIHYYTRFAAKSHSRPWQTLWRKFKVLTKSHGPSAGTSRLATTLFNKVYVICTELYVCINIFYTYYKYINDLNKFHSNDLIPSQKPMIALHTELC